MRDYEPAAALYAGPTGLEVYERLIPQAREMLTPGGWLILEIGYGQRDALGRMLSEWADLALKRICKGFPVLGFAIQADAASPPFVVADAPEIRGIERKAKRRDGLPPSLREDGAPKGCDRDRKKTSDPSIALGAGSRLRSG